MPQQQQPNAQAQAAQAAQQLFAQFPHLRYRKDETVIRAEVAFEQQLMASQRRITSTNHIQPRILAEEHLLPLIGMHHQWVQLQLADLLQFTQAAILEHGEASAQIGIPAEDAESWLGALDEVIAVLSDEEALKDEAKRKDAVETLNALKEAIAEVAIEEGTDEDEDELDFGDDEDEDEDEDTEDADGEETPDEPLLED